MKTPVIVPAVEAGIGPPGGASGSGAVSAGGGDGLFQALLGVLLGAAPAAGPSIPAAEAVPAPTTELAATERSANDPAQAALLGLWLAQLAPTPMPLDAPQPGSDGQRSAQGASTPSATTGDAQLTALIAANDAAPELDAAIPDEAMAHFSMPRVTVADAARDSILQPGRLATPSTSATSLDGLPTGWTQPTATASNAVTPTTDSAAQADADRTNATLTAPDATAVALDAPTASASHAIHQAAATNPTDGATAAKADGPLSQAAIDEIVHQARVTTMPGHSSLRLRLEPADLGRVEVTIDLTASGAAVRLTAANHDAHAAIERQLPALRSALEASGFSADRLTVTADTLAASLAGGMSFDLGRQGLPQRFGQPATAPTIAGFRAGGSVDAADERPVVAAVSGRGLVDYRV
jgi:flagellar hook-length control protein FliK